MEAALRCLEQERSAAEAELRREYTALRGRVEAEEAARRGDEARAALELQLSAATEAAQSEWQRAESAAEELEEVRGDNQRLEAARGDNQRLSAALEEARGDIQRLTAALEEAKAPRLPEIASGPISPSEIEAMRAAAVNC